MGIECWVDEDSGEIFKNGKPFAGDAKYKTYRRFDGIGPAEEYSKTIKKRNKPNKSSSSNDGGDGVKFHGLYCLLVGWWLAMVIVCMILPLFFKGGRKLIKKAFGIW